MGWRRVPTAQEVPHQQEAHPLPWFAPPTAAPATPWGGGRRERGGRERRRKGASKAKARQDTPWDHTELATSPKQLNPLHQPAQVSLSPPRAPSQANSGPAASYLKATPLACFRFPNLPLAPTVSTTPESLGRSSRPPLPFQPPFLSQTYPPTLLSALTPIYTFQNIYVPLIP